MGLGLSIAKRHALLSGGDIVLVDGELGGRGVQGDAAGVRPDRRSGEPSVDPHPPRRRRRRRAEHRPIAAPDSRGRRLPRDRVRLGRAVSRRAAPGPRRSVPARPASAGRQRHRSAAIAEAERRRDAGGDDFRARHDPRRGGCDAERRLRLPGKAARARSRAARHQERDRARPTCSARTSGSASWSATRRR